MSQSSPLPARTPHKKKKTLRTEAEPPLEGEAPVATEGHGGGEQPSEGSLPASELEAAESPSSPAADAS